MDSLPDLALTSEFRREYAVRIKHSGQLIPITAARAAELLAAGPAEGAKLELVSRAVFINVTDWASYTDVDDRPL